MPKAATKIDDGLQRQEWWHRCKRVCGSCQRKLKIACSEIDGIIARGRLDHAKGCNKNERWFATTRSKALVKRKQGTQSLGREERLAMEGLQ
jgi:hypothetical protein